MYMCSRLVERCMLLNKKYVVSDYLHSEVLMGRVAGPFCPRVIPHVHIRFGRLVPP